MTFVQKLRAYLSLMRPANMITAVSDIWAGAAIAGYFATLFTRSIHFAPVVFLSLSTLGLYGGGVVFNDVFDAAIDKKERPERAIPSGKVSRVEAGTLGTLLLLGGILAGGAVSHLSGIVAFLVAVAALLYDQFFKPHPVWGPLNMGICRALNLLLGISSIPSALDHWWLLTIIPVIYIAAITLISRGEVHGGSKRILYLALALYSLVAGVMLFFACRSGQVFQALLFLLLFVAWIFPPLFSAIKNPEGRLVGKAVKAGVIALIIMNATWAAIFSSVAVAAIILLLLPCSLLLAKLFAVT